MIPVYKPYLFGNEKNYINKCIDSTWISSKGEFIEEFEKKFSEFIGVDYSTSVSNGTVALHLALQSIGIKEGDEVIVPALTYVASVNTILQCGAVPVFVDSLQETWQIDPSDILNKITDRTKAVMVVHLYGLPCDMQRISTLCKERGLLLIEDCAEAFGSVYAGKHVGCFGDVSTFSFFGNKTITTGEGGMVVSPRRDVIEKAAHLKSQGVSKEKEYWHTELAFNYRMTNIQAAIGVAQLEKASEILEKKRIIANAYKSFFIRSKLPITFHDEMPETRHSFWMCSIHVGNKQVRDDLRNWLKKSNIETRPVFYLATDLPHIKKYQNSQYPNAKIISESGLNLPSWPGMESNEIEFICSSIAKFFD